MFVLRFMPAAIAAGLLLGAARAEAQTDFRNLDDERPTLGEDAFPIERYAIELMLPTRALRAGGRVEGSLDPEIMVGALPNGMIGAKLPLTLGEGERAALAAPRLFALYNLNGESATLPAFALRADVTIPAGAAGGEEARVTLKGIATRTFGPTRLHVNAAWTPGDAAGAPTRDAPPRWFGSLTADRTLYRSSLLLLGELAVEEPLSRGPLDATTTLGLRWQWTPSLVLDAGVFGRVAGAERGVGLTLGLSHTLGLRGWLPRRDAAAADPRAHVGRNRTEWLYYPGDFNWQLQARYPDAAKLFHAFDYGHAVLYERLYTRAPDATAALDSAYRFLTEELLRRPPRFGIAEEVVEPVYARIAGRAKEAFDWAHVLHRQLYDIYADERLPDAEKARLAEAATDYYLARRGYAFASLPKSMALMDEQEFSLVFRRRHAAFNGLIWAYHWLQVGLYEPLLAAGSAEERAEGVRRTVAAFFAMVDDPSRFPATMPMTPAVAPTFTARHPRAAAIFDNLHMMHDIISDILADERIPRDAKGAMIDRQLDRLLEPTGDLMPLEEWRSMGHGEHHGH